MNKALEPEVLRDLIAEALDDGKADDIQVLDVRGVTSITDFMIVASGRSSRQVKALKNRILEAAKIREIRQLGVEGEATGEWILIDFGDVIVHIMQPETRGFYQLEKLWDRSAFDKQAGDAVVDA